MQEKEFEELTDEEFEEITTRGYLMILENPKLATFKKGEYICAPDAPYEVRMVVRAKNERNAIMSNFYAK